MKKALIVTALALCAIALQTHVQAATTTKNISGTIKGTLLVPPASGACVAGYADQCPSGNCVNLTPVGTPTGSGTIKTGTVTNMCVTVDLGLAVDAPTDSKNTCAPYFGTLTYNETKSGSAATINLTGAYCRRQATSKTSSLEGGYGLAGSSDDPSATGWGTATGTIKEDTGVFSLKVSGSFTP